MPDPLVRRIDARDDGPDPGEVVGVLRHVQATGLQQRQEGHLVDQLGMLLEQQLEGEKPADDVLRRVRAVHPQDEAAAVPPYGRVEVADVPGHLVGGSQGVHGVHVDGDGIRAGVDLASLVRHRHRGEVDRQPQQLLGAQQEVAREPLGVESDDVVAEQAVEQTVAHSGRKDAPGVGAGPGNVDEMRDDGVGTRPAHLLGDEVEVVVVQHHQGLAAPLLHLGHHRVGECLVDRHVAVLEGAALPGGQHRGRGGSVEAVLDEPQQRVGDDGVEVLVLVPRHVDHADVEDGVPVLCPRDCLVEQPRLVPHDDGYGATAALADERHVLVRDGAADPHGLLELPCDAHERRDETAAAAGQRALGPVPAKGHGTAVGQDDDGKVG